MSKQCFSWKGPINLTIKFFMEILYKEIEQKQSINNIWLFWRLIFLCLVFTLFLQQKRFFLHTGVSGRIRAINGFKMPNWIDISLKIGPSPAMLPKAQTACSATFLRDDESNLIRGVRAPHSITCLVCLVFPEAILVRAQAASNWISGLFKKRFGCIIYIFQHLK